MMMIISNQSANENCLKSTYSIWHHRVDVTENVGVDGALGLVASKALVTQREPQTVTTMASSSHLH
jgi:hypothetical protein